MESWLQSDFPLIVVPCAGRGNEAGGWGGRGVVLIQVNLQLRCRGILSLSPGAVF